MKILILLLFLPIQSFAITIAEDNALTKFESSENNSMFAKCVGIDGDVQWTIGETYGYKNKNVRLVQAKLTKNNKQFIVQYVYNLKTGLEEEIFHGPADFPSGKKIATSEALESFKKFCSGMKDK